MRMDDQNPQWGKFLDQIDWWDCDGTMAITAKVLKDMGLSEEDIIKSMQWLQKKGAYCDCEIFFNILEE